MICSLGLLHAAILKTRTLIIKKLYPFYVKICWIKKRKLESKLRDGKEH